MKRICIKICWGPLRYAVSLVALAVVPTQACTNLNGISDYKINSDSTNSLNGGCSTNKECIDQNGEFFICRQKDKKCIALLSKDPPCSTVIGNYASDSAVIFGSLLPTTGKSSGTGIPIENSIKVGVSDFVDVGLPPKPGTKERRPLVFVGCSDGGDVVTAEKSANFLIDQIGVPAIIGPVFSGIVLSVAKDVTIPKGVLLYTPSASSSKVTGLMSNGLVWRGTNADGVLMAGLSTFFNTSIVAYVTDKDKLGPNDPMKVAIVHKGDAFGQGLYAAIKDKINLNGKNALDPSNSMNFKAIDYGNPDVPAASNPDPPNYPDAVSKTTDFLPHVIFLFGVAESITQVLSQIESTWPANAAYRPLYLMTPGQIVPDLWAYLKQNDPNDTLRARIFGVQSGSNGENFREFKIRYNELIKDNTSPNGSGTGASYDGVYLLAYSAVSLLGKDITGANLGAAMANLVPPAAVRIDVGPSNINSAFSALLSGAKIDYSGAFGPYDFDLSTGESRTDVQIWCVPRDPSGAPSPAITSGAYYDQASGTLKGSINDAITTCALKQPM